MTWDGILTFFCFCDTYVSLFSFLERTQCQPQRRFPSAPAFELSLIKIQFQYQKRHSIRAKKLRHDAAQTSNYSAGRGVFFVLNSDWYQVKITRTCKSENWFLEKFYDQSWVQVWSDPTSTKRKPPSQLSKFRKPIVRLRIEVILEKLG